MLKIRLQRVGRKHEPSFRLVLTESENSTKSGRFGEILGSYDPRKASEALKADRIKHWISQGAGLTASVNNLLVKKGIIRGKKIDVSAGDAPILAPVVEAAPVAETPVEVPVEAPVEAALAVETAPEAPVEVPVEAPIEETPAPEVVPETPAEDTPTEPVV